MVRLLLIIRLLRPHSPIDDLPCFAVLRFDVLASLHLTPDEKDIQIALLRQQLRVLERKAKTKPVTPKNFILR